jgi:phosphinothricin acetyltransferase
MSIDFTISEAKVSDLKEIRNIYDHYVLNTYATLDEKTPSEDEMLELYSNILGKNLPFLVAKHSNQVVGYCYSQPYRKRSAYRYTIEESIYVHKDFLRNGIATDLLSETMKKCKEVGYKQMIAIVIYSGNEQSVDFHESMGFVENGRLINVGYKFDTWVDTVLFQREL